jgi:hypothetical protein
MVIRQGDRTFQPGDLATKAPEETLSFVFDWTEELSDGLAVVQSSFAVVAIRPATDSALEIVDMDVLDGDVEARVSISAGQLGSTYLISNVVTTTASPPEIFRSGLVVLVQR